jgi:hypothetical protein
MKQSKVYKILAIILIIQWAFIQLLTMYPKLIETFYTYGLYQIISKSLRFLLGWIPFSIGDVIYFILILVLIKSIYEVLKYRKINFNRFLFKTLGIFSIIIFFFNFNWGLNYLRPSLTSVLNISNSKYATNELVAFTKQLIVKTNEIQQKITKNDTIVVDDPKTKKELRIMAFAAYKQLAKQNPLFEYNYYSVKSSMFSVPLTYMGFAGYLNPFTNEAQVNYLIPKNSYPATVCHEMAHQIGIASESGANFVGYLAAINSEDSYFNYAGYLMALKYCLYEVYNKNPKEYKLLKTSINKGILKDLQQNQEFWKSYQNWSEKYFKRFYNTFLKANKQKDGIKGYNKVVFLLINYYYSHQL